MKRIKSDRILTAGGTVSGYVYYDGPSIQAVTAEELPFDEEYDATGCYVSPGFIDLHTHGGGGYSFSGDAEKILAGCRFHLRHGTTALCPTVSATDIRQMQASLKQIARAMASTAPENIILGAHLEGPYLSTAQAGAQCADYITPPRPEDYLPILSEDSDVIARWTYAPENDRDAEFAKTLRDHGILASAGHTDAVYEDMLQAMEAGCRLVTHLYSCTSTVTRKQGFRRLGVIETAFLHDELFVEIICDGKHLPPELIHLIYKIKRADRIALITDSLALAGTDATEGVMQHTPFLIEDGVCKLKDRSAFAGSIATADRLLRVAVQEAKIPLEDAVRMLTATPATILGCRTKGSLAPGMDADAVVLTGTLEVRAVFARGVRVKG